MTDDTDDTAETQGAVDSGYDDGMKPYAERVADALDGVQTEPVEGGIAIDLVTRQTVFVRQVSYETCADHYEAEGYDLVSYKMHPWLPGIGPENTVYECVYTDSNPQNTHKHGRTYDFPSARLMYYPVEMAWRDKSVGDV